MVWGMAPTFLGVMDIRLVGTDIIDWRFVVDPN